MDKQQQQQQQHRFTTTNRNGSFTSGLMSKLCNRKLKVPGKSFLLTLCFVSIALEAWTLSMVGGNNSQKFFSKHSTDAIENLAFTAKRVLSTMLHEPRALPVVGGGHPTSRPVSSFYSDNPHPRPKSTQFVDANSHNNQTMCVRARTFKLSESTVRVTVCLYRTTPIVDIRRWSNGVVEHTLKPVVMTAREYFGLSNQHDSIVKQIHTLENLRINREKDRLRNHDEAEAEEDVAKPTQPIAIDDVSVQDEGVSR